MINKNLYYVTSVQNAEDIITSGFRASLRDRHWLGDGYYFYEETFFAFKWCLELCSDCYGDGVELSKLLDNYKIITAEVSIDEKRVFDLKTVQHKELFDLSFHELRKNPGKRKAEEIKGYCSFY
ncbi:hypothetical protein [Natranaerobius trueperi]|uniref:Uncharacterized protein n=1 Tax=Natranaerobius trueperi TaxID=759412 RepID=A0A226BWI0_9FIRM|nr:hypothetical protein [Natranaerobius trueperi]OWZ83356.1 hypothetical protein CDO51_09050 [Natranaerobius trueperi]